MYFHYQNLKKEEGGRHLVNGRCWIGDKPQFHCQWVVALSDFSIELNLNDYGDDAIGGNISLGIFAFYWGLECKWLYKLLEPITKRKDQTYTNGRKIGVRLGRGGLWIALWDDPMESRGKDPWWWHMHIDFKDKILGRAKHSSEIIETGETSITMPEGKYRATYKVEKRTWRRSRWPFKRTRTGIDFDIPGCIPHDGKGENSWDCGMDGTCGMSVEYVNRGGMRGMTDKVAMRSLESRQRYGRLDYFNLENLAKHGYVLEDGFIIHKKINDRNETDASKASSVVESDELLAHEQGSLS